METDCSDVSLSQRTQDRQQRPGERHTTVSPRNYRRNQPCWLPDLDSWAPELQGDKFLLFSAPQFVVICFSVLGNYQIEWHLTKVRWVFCHRGLGLLTTNLVLGTLLGCSLMLQGRLPWFTGQEELKGRFPSVFTTMASAPHPENAVCPPQRNQVIIPLPGISLWGISGSSVPNLFLKITWLSWTTGMLPGPHALCTAQLQGAPSQSHQHKLHLWGGGTQPAPLHRGTVTTAAEQVKVPGRQRFREIAPTPLAPAFWQNCLVGLSLRR